MGIKGWHDRTEEAPPKDTLVWTCNTEEDKPALVAICAKGCCAINPVGEEIAFNFWKTPTLQEVDAAMADIKKMQAQVLSAMETLSKHDVYDDIRMVPVHRGNNVIH